MSNISSEQTRQWVANGPDNKIIDVINETGKFIKNNRLTTSQIRNIFGTIKQIESIGFENKQADFIMLKPLTAYAYSRNKNKGFEVLKEAIIDPGIDEVLKEENDKEKTIKFKNFVKLFEAVLSYHKYHGGR